MRSGWCDWNVFPKQQVCETAAPRTVRRVGLREVEDPDVSCFFQREGLAMFSNMLSYKMKTPLFATVLPVLYIIGVAETRAFPAMRVLAVWR